ncbi:hypothetical protein [Citrobacter braakii]|uniref:hypothetical protein n=1 Tax=Citrobacter braakii TaxID=57706 RepID=UPI002B24394C|nr:hypothetical protein [Citrobacter braakii]MEB2305470.1 hypothetical protein [Citrobacter braakii]
MTGTKLGKENLQKISDAFLSATLSAIRVEAYVEQTGYTSYLASNLTGRPSDNKYVISENSPVYQCIGVRTGAYLNEMLILSNCGDGGGTHYTTSLDMISNNTSVRVNTNDESEIYAPGSTQITAEYSITIGNSTRPFSGVPVGDTPYHIASRQIQCIRVPLQLEIAVDNLVDFREVTTGISSVRREFGVNIISGTQVPAGTLTFSSTSTKSNGRINLGGGEVSISNKNADSEYLMDNAYPITARETTFVAELNASGATPGTSTENLTINMVVN